MKPFIYFDLGKVLLDFDFTEAGLAFSLLTGKDGLGIIEQMFTEELDFCNQFETGGISSADFFAFIIKRFELNVRIDELEEAYNDIFTPIDGMEPLVADLADQGYRLGILSNTCPPHWNFCRRKYAALFSHFEVQAPSFELRAMKPFREIYQHAAKLAGVNFSDIIFIDDRAENIEAACACGIAGHVFRSEEKLRAFLASRGIQVRR